MSYYSFIFKQDELVLELTSENSAIVVREADKFISELLAMPSLEQPAQKAPEPKVAQAEPTKAEPKVKEVKKEDTPVEPPVVEEKPKEPIVESSVPASAFGDILNKKITEEPLVSKEPASTPKQTDVKTKPQIQSLKSLVQLKNPQRSVDYLLLAAHYLNEVEGLKKYSLKQINTKVLTVSSTPIDHGAIQEAVVSEFVEIVPDVTGMADVTEYALTQKGEFYIFNEM